MSLPAAAKLGSYEIKSLLGSGAMGEVYRARDPRLQRDVAVKVLPAKFASDTDRNRRFQIEARAAAALNHPNILAVHDVGTHDGRPYVVTELLEGQTLRELLAQGMLSLKRTLDHAIQIANGLVAAHEKGIVHRDLKPENLFVTADGRVKILDFGLAKLVEAISAPVDPALVSTETAATSPGAVLGTVGYMSPEQARGRAVDNRSDIFSFGAIVYEMLSGERAFKGETSIETLSAILSKDPPPLTTVVPAMPVSVDRLIQRCFAKAPIERYQSTRDLAFALVMAAESLGSSRDVQRAPQAASSARELAELTFPLSESVCRKLNRVTLDARMIGDHLQYVDNGVASDTLVCFLHGTGLDCHQFDHLLKRMPQHAVAPTLYGCEPHARRRIRLPLSDHLIIIREWLKHVAERDRPALLILVGFSTGSDLWLQFLCPPVYDPAIQIHGVLLLDTNINLETCFFTRVLATMATDTPTRVLENLRSFGGQARSLGDWVNIHEYLVQVLRKFHADIDVLGSLAAEIVHPFANGGLDEFAKRYRAVTAVAPGVRFVFSEANRANQAGVMNAKLSNLDSGLLGENYRDNSLVLEPDADHFDLLQYHHLEPHLGAVIAAARK